MQITKPVNSGLNALNWVTLLNVERKVSTDTAVHSETKKPDDIVWFFLADIS